MRQKTRAPWLRKILWIVLFLTVYFFNPKTVRAQICPGVQYELTPPDGQIYPETNELSIKITSSYDCFTTSGDDYSFIFWKEGSRWENGWIDFVKPTNPREILIKRTLVGNLKDIGEWNVYVWYGRGVQKRNITTIVLDLKYRVNLHGGNPILKPEKPAYQVGNKATFIVENAQINQEYSFWWDGDHTPRLVQKATKNSFSFTPDPAINDPGDKKFCMNIGRHLVSPACLFWTTVKFTAGPPPVYPTGYQPGGGVSLTRCTPSNGKVDSGIETAIGCIPVDDLNDFVGWLLSKVIFIASGIAFLLMAFGALQIITSAGKPESVKAGQELITSALSGLLLIILSLFLLKLIGVDILRIPGFGN